MSAGVALVTGAAGFVGRELVHRLQAEGHRVRAAVRTPAATTADETVTIGDIGPGTDWSTALDGVDVVFHLAARVHMRSDGTSRDAQAFQRVNAEGSAVLARAAARTGVRRLVYVSSIKVNGEATGREPFRASDPPAPQDPYGRSKLDAELAIARAAAETGMEFAIVRPPLVYGPGVKANFLRLCRRVDRGTPLPLAAVHNRRSLVFVGNLCDLLVRCGWHSGAARGTFLAADGEDVSTPELIRRLARALQRRPRLLPVPEPLLRAAARLVGLSGAIGSLCDSLAVDIGPTCSVLDWTPPHSLDEGLAETARWWRNSSSVQERIERSARYA